ncbi:hypothetical protein FM106_24405 [Brachybacterium faecium]|nr:hypothetical protein FM106_24405 [Brachybacterium faecium]
MTGYFYRSLNEIVPVPFISEKCNGILYNRNNDRVNKNYSVLDI